MMITISKTSSEKSRKSVIFFSGAANVWAMQAEKLHSAGTASFQFSVQDCAISHSTVNIIAMSLENMIPAKIYLAKHLSLITLFRSQKNILLWSSHKVLSSF